MSRLSYRGETYCKKISRSLVWQQHQYLLGDGFHSTAHLFLASSVAGDIATLSSLGVDPDNIWAIEMGSDQCKSLYQRKKREGFRLFNRKIEEVVEETSASGDVEHLYSTYLDFCGNIQGTKRSTSRVISCLPRSSVVSITLFLGREQEEVDDREAELIRIIKASTRHPVSLVQSISYYSENSASKGSAMQTWTFYLDKRPHRGKMRFDLRRISEDSEAEIRAQDLWSKNLRQSEIRSAAAVQANITRRLR